MFFTDFGALVVDGRRLLLLGGERPAVQEVPCYGAGSDMATFIERAGLTAGTGTFPDGQRVIYVYDRHDGGFGYAWNVDDPDLSEWGYAPVDDGGDAA